MEAFRCRHLLDLVDDVAADIADRPVRVVEIGATTCHLFTLLDRRLVIDYAGVQPDRRLVAVARMRHIGCPNFRMLHRSLMDDRLYQEIVEPDVVILDGSCERLRDDDATRAIERIARLAPRVVVCLTDRLQRPDTSAAMNRLASGVKRRMEIREVLKTPFQWVPRMLATSTIVIATPISAPLALDVAAVRSSTSTLVRWQIGVRRAGAGAGRWTAALGRGAVAVLLLPVTGAAWLLRTLVVRPMRATVAMMAAAGPWMLRATGATAVFLLRFPGMVGMGVVRAMDGATMRTTDIAARCARPVATGSARAKSVVATACARTASAVAIRSGRVVDAVASRSASAASACMRVPAVGGAWTLQATAGLVRSASRAAIEARRVGESTLGASTAGMQHARADVIRIAAHASLASGSLVEACRSLVVRGSGRARVDLRRALVDTSNDRMQLEQRVRTHLSLAGSTLRHQMHAALNRAAQFGRQAKPQLSRSALELRDQMHDMSIEAAELGRVLGSGLLRVGTAVASYCQAGLRLVHDASRRVLRGVIAKATGVNDAIERVANRLSDAANPNLRHGWWDQPASWSPIDETEYRVGEPRGWPFDLIPNERTAD